MVTAGDALAKTLARSQKVTFWSQKNGFGCFFFCSLLEMLLGGVDLLSKGNSSIDSLFQQFRRAYSRKGFDSWHQEAQFFAQKN